MSRRSPASGPTRRSSRRDDDPLAVFVRGATVGAFVGAVIAGSTLWRRLRLGIASRPVAGPRPRGPAAPPRPNGGPGRP